tara:strand:- start:230 stop:451 length:222 start_codon:yes stop_codon:yes gene_type:complete
MKRKEQKGLGVKVKNNDVDFALKILKRKIRDSNLFLELRKRQYYEKPSKKKRDRKNPIRTVNQYSDLKEKKYY